MKGINMKMFTDNTFFTIQTSCSQFKIQYARKQEKMRELRSRVFPMKGRLQLALRKAKEIDISLDLSTILLFRLNQELDLKNKLVASFILNLGNELRDETKKNSDLYRKNIFLVGSFQIFKHTFFDCL